MPSLEENFFREAAFMLLYNQHGGSGLPLTLSDVMEMEFPELQWWVERLSEMRSAEAAELRKVTSR